MAKIIGREYDDSVKVHTISSKGNKAEVIVIQSLPQKQAGKTLTELTTKHLLLHNGVWKDNLGTKYEV